MANKRIKQLKVSSTAYDLEGYPWVYTGEMKKLVTPGVYQVSLEQNGTTPTIGGPAFKNTSSGATGGTTLIVTVVPNATPTQTTKAEVYHTTTYNGYLYQRLVTEDATLSNWMASKNLLNTATAGTSTGGATSGTSTASAHTHSVTIESATVELQQVSIPTVTYNASTRNLTFGTTTVNALCTTGDTGTTSINTTEAGSHSHTVNSHTHTQQ